MKITIDTQAKTIEVESQIQLGELVKELDKFLPQWREYKLIPKTDYYQGFPYMPVYTPSTVGPITLGNAICTTGNITLVSNEYPYSDNYETYNTQPA